MSWGGSRIFSERPGADFQEIVENFVDQINFPSDLRTILKQYFDRKLCAAGKFLEKKEQVKMPLSGTYWKILTKIKSFFCARYPSKLVYISAFRKVSGLVGLKMMSYKIVLKGTLW